MSPRFLSLATVCLFASLSLAHEHNHEHGDLAVAAPSIASESLYQLDSEWLDSTGAKLKLSKLAGKARLVAMTYSNCTTACPMIVQDMVAVRAKLPKKQQKDLALTLFSLDSGRDTPEQLRKFASKRHLKAEDWTLLTAVDPGSVNELAAALGVQFKRLENGDFVHSNVIFALNAKGEIVSKKEGLKTESSAFVKDLKKTLESPKL